MSILSRCVWGPPESSLLQCSYRGLGGQSARASPGGIQLPCPTLGVSFQKVPREEEPSRVGTLGPLGKTLLGGGIYQAGSQEDTEGALRPVNGGVSPASLNCAKMDIRFTISPMFRCTVR